jgi:hypothetical protein
MQFTETLREIKYEDIPLADRWPNQHTGYPKTRPNVKADHGGKRKISGLHLIGMRNLGGVYVDFSFNHSNDEPPLTFSEVELSNLWFEGTLRVPEENGGNHMDDINVRGGWNEAIKCFLKMSKIQVDGSRSGSPAIYINEGNFEQIDMEEIEVNSPQWTSAIDMKDQSWIPGKQPKFVTKKVVIRRSPGFELLLQGPPGSVLEVFHEPGVIVRGAIWNGVHTGAKIYQIEPGAPAIIPQPPQQPPTTEQRLDLLEKQLQGQTQINQSQQQTIESLLQQNSATLESVQIMLKSQKEHVDHQVGSVIEDLISLSRSHDKMRETIQALDNLVKAIPDHGPQILEVKKYSEETRALLLKLKTGLLRRVTALEKKR